jgi:hypothetical protein
MKTGLERITQLVTEHPDRKLQTIMHLVNAETLKGVHDRQDKNKAYGIDGVTKTEYGENIEGKIEDLLARMKRFGYRPQPVRRTYIPKDGTDQLRPLGIPTVSAHCTDTQSGLRNRYNHPSISPATRGNLPYSENP